MAGRSSGIKFGKNYLLVIGIDQYKNGIPTLRNAVSDAKAFKDTLVEHYQFEDEKPYTVCLFDQEATRRQIIRVFDNLILKVQPEDSVVFYFSGHGEFLEHIKKGYWIPVDAELNDRSTYLSNDEVQGLIKSLKARHVFGIVDSCFSGALFRTRSLTSVTERIISMPSRWLITSGQLEPVSDGALGERSPFCKRLLVQLENNVDDALWVSELCQGVMKGFQYNPQKQVPEWAPLMDAGHEGGQFVFLRKSAEWKAVIEEEKAFRKENPPEKDRQRDLSSGKNGNDANQPPELPPLPPPDLTTLEGMKKHLSMQVGLGNIPTVFNVLYDRLKDDDKRTTILVRYGEYNNNKKKENAGIADERDLRLSYNKISNAFSNIINNLTEGDITLDA